MCQVVGLPWSSGGAVVRSARSFGRRSVHPIGGLTAARGGYRPPIEQRLPSFLRLEALRRLLAIGRQDPPFWWYPSCSLALGLVLGAVSSRLRGVDAGSLSFAVYDGGAEAARSFVTLVATALATITTLTLTLTVISLQLASSQYSPRLIEHYLSDRANHAVFSLFLGTFAFSIATLLNIRLPSEDADVGMVPGIAISLLVVLTVACLGALVFFVHRVTTSMRVEAILRRVRDRTVDAVERRRVLEGDEEPESLPSAPAGARPIRSRRSGYYADIDWDRVEGFDPGRTCHVWVIVATGDFVTVGTPVALVDGDVDDDTIDEIESWLRFDSERWIEADYSYGVRNLVDVALKGLSPGVNDPTTATMAIERMGEAMAIAGDEHPARIVRTDHGTEVHVAVREWGDTLRSAVRQIAEYGRRDVAVVAALVRMLAGLAWARTSVDRRPVIRETAVALRDWVALDVERDRWDLERIDAEFALLDRALDHEPVAKRRHLL